MADVRQVLDCTFTSTGFMCMDCGERVSTLRSGNVFRVAPAAHECGDVGTIRVVEAPMPFTRAPDGPDDFVLTFLPGDGGTEVRRSVPGHAEDCECAGCGGDVGR